MSHESTPQVLNRVAITGMGGICGLGSTLNEIWPNLISGKSGISHIEEFTDDKLFPIKFAGIVKNFTLNPDILSEKEQRKYGRFLLLALQAADEAMSNLNLMQSYEPDRIGSIIGTGMGGFDLLESNYKQFFEKGARRINPFLIPGIIPNMTPGLFSILHGFHGINYSVSSACASSGHALSAAANEIRLGTHDAIISGGTESVVTGITLGGFNQMKALGKGFDDVTKISRPFDKDRCGFVMGEGAGILVLENYEKAKKRGAPILAELVGYGSSSDAHHIAAPHPEGKGAMTAMLNAMRNADLRPEQIDYINAHGTSTPLGDKIEVQAVKKVFGDHAYKLAMTSTKSSIGHLLGAAGGIESVLCIKAMMENTIPPTINLTNPDPECDLNFVPNVGIKKELNYVLNNTFGFGGTNSTLIFKAQ
ncbi:beta-ketoacyl-ACP synthase II [Bacteriovoracaceae bacterium]|nr:beta-ketoacyl-ACP synthase II [Bacteriovoracaceae bacterium]